MRYSPTVLLINKSKMYKMLQNEAKQTPQLIADGLSKLRVGNSQSLALTLSLEKLAKALGQLAVHEVRRSVQSISRVLELVESFQLDHLNATPQLLTEEPRTKCTPQPLHVSRGYI